MSDLLRMTREPEEAVVVGLGAGSTFWVSEHTDDKTGERFSVIAHAGGKCTVVERITESRGSRPKH